MKLICLLGYLIETLSYNEYYFEEIAYYVTDNNDLCAIRCVTLYSR